MKSLKTVTRLAYFAASLALASSASAGSNVLAQSGIIKLKSGDYHSLNKEYFVTDFVVQDAEGNIHFYEGVDTVEGAGTPAIYSPDKTPNEYVTDSRATVDSSTVASCAPTTEKPQPCDPALYDASGALLIKAGDIYDVKQTFTVLDQTTFVLGQITYTYYRNNAVIVEEGGPWSALTFIIGAAPPLNAPGT
jgi:hypothetical protein